MIDTTSLDIVREELNRRYGNSWTTWLPETLKSIIEKPGEKVRDIDLNRIKVLQNIYSNDLFWNDVEIFEASINFINWNWVGSVHPSPAQIVLGIKTINSLVDKEKQFSEDVLKYIASIFIDADIVWVPDDFLVQGINQYLSKYFEDEPFITSVKSKWHEMIDNEKWFNFEENEVDIQCAKLLAIRKYVNMGGFSRSESTDPLYKIILE